MISKRSMLVPILVVGLVALAGTGSALTTADIQDTTYETIDQTGTSPTDALALNTSLPSNVTDTIALMSDTACSLGLTVLETQGWGVPANRDELGYENERLSGPCKDFRDALTHRVLDGDDPPYIEYCNYTVGINCVAVGHHACDFGLILDAGLVYMCEGGITPYN